MQHLSRCIVMNTLSELRATLAKEEHYKLTASLKDMSTSTDSLGPRAEWTVYKTGVEYMKVVVLLQTFSIEAWRNVIPIRSQANEKSKGTQQWSCVWSTTSASDETSPPLLYRKDVEGNYATRLSSVKRGRVMGFGEQGGLSLLKDKQQLNLYNYDNLAYSSVYGDQALNPAEPLYHSDPFGVELNGVPGYQSCIGIFVDDVSQVFFDLGSTNEGVMQIGSRFADLEVHITCADDLEHACLAHSSCVGRGKLFPRFMLGYQQGCYGYDTTDKVMTCASQHRKYGIPLDGIHIDVDLQERYRTFTMDDGPNGKFKNPKAMFAQLKQMGIKCSTNITPVISTEDKTGKSYWDTSSNARKEYITLDDGLQKGYFIKDRRWNSTTNPPTYSYWEGGQLQQTASAHIDNMNDANTEYRGGVSYGANLGTSGVYPDLGRSEVRDWWGEQYAALFDAGLSMVWQDMTTPCIMTGVGDMKTFPFRLLLSDDSISGREDKGILTPALKVNNLYSYNLHKATYKGLQKLGSRKGLRNFIIGRGSFTGQHRYAGTWTGDNVSSWQFLRINIQQVISMGIGGTIITGADVGGFERSPWTSQWCDPSLLIRWTLANTLLPWFRNHYIGKPGAKLFQEPYAYYENAWRGPTQKALYESVLPICR
jgi:alpha-glucosidase